MCEKRWSLEGRPIFDSTGKPGNQGVWKRRDIIDMTDISKAPVGFQLKVVLICSSFGRSFAQEVNQTGKCSYLLQGNAGSTPHVTKALIEVADIPVLGYWLKAIHACPRLLPLQDKVYIVCNNDNYDEFVTWATTPSRSMGGFPVANIINTGESGHQRGGPVRDLAHFIHTTNSHDSNLLVIDSDYFFEPEFNLNRIVEHSMMRGKDTLTFMSPLAGTDLTESYQVVLATVWKLPQVSFDPSATMEELAVCPRVAAVNAQPQGAADGNTYVLGPCFVLRRTALPLVLEVAHQDFPVWRQMGRLLEHVVRSRHVYALPVDFFFNVRTLHHFMLTDAFFRHLTQHQARLGLITSPVSDAVEVPSTNTKSATALLKTVPPKLKKHSMSSSTAEATGHTTFLSKQAAPLPGLSAAAGALHSSIKPMLAEFQDRWTRIRSDIVAESSQEKQTVPDRFTQLGSWHNRAATTQHPVYTTTSAIYGSKSPSAQEMPTTWNGIQGAFTNTFTTGPYQKNGLVTATTRSNVHKALDDF